MIIFKLCLWSLPIWIMSCFNSGKVITNHTDNMHNVQPATTFHTLKAIDINGNEVPMSEYKGKKIIVLNTASKCGYTPQYADWQAFYEKNSESFVVLGFPCNQFLGQEPGSSEEIATFCSANYGVTFPMFEKVNVKGKNQSPVYQWLSSPEQNGWCDEVPGWNFCKYMINEQGELTHFFGSKVKPDSEEFLKAIQ